MTPPVEGASSLVETLKLLLLRSGAEWVLWLLFALSVASIAVAVERLAFLRRKGEDVRGLAGMLDAHLRAGRREAALAELSGLGSVAATVASAGLRLAERGPEAAAKAMEGALALERKGLEARLAYLGTLGNNAPFVGLLGTVIGVVLAFDALGQVGGAQAGAAASAAVMSAIAEALVATAVGIAVALPAVAAYNYFQRRIAGILSEAEVLSCLVVAYLTDAGAPGARPAPGEDR